MYHSNQTGPEVQAPQTGRRPSPSTFNPQPSTEFPPSVQSDLFSYLKPHQREAIRPYLRLIKPQYQEPLCVSLLDYLEGHGLEPLAEPVLSMLQEEIVCSCGLRPLTEGSSGSRFKVQGSSGSRFKVQGSKFQDPGFKIQDPKFPQPSSLNPQPSHEPKSLKTIIKQLFPNLSNLSNPSNL